MTRAETFNKAISALREAAGESTFIVGCGSPIVSAVGYFDGMRVSADTGPTYKPPLPMPWWDQANLPCLRSMIRNSINRTCLSSRFWHNDPDCLLLRKSTSLSTDEVVSAASVVAMTSGMLLLSDDLSKVSADRLKIVTRITPPSNAPALPLDLHVNTMPAIMRMICSDKESGGSERRDGCEVASGLGRWSVVSLSNWGDQNKIVKCPLLALDAPRGGADELAFHVINFWSGKYQYLCETEHSNLKVGLRKRQTEICICKVATHDKAIYLGSTFHFTCGLEVQEIGGARGKVGEGGEFNVVLKTDFNKGKGRVFFYLPTSDQGKVICHINDKVCNPSSWEVLEVVGDTAGKRGIVVRVVETMRVGGEKVKISFIW